MDKILFIVPPNIHYTNFIRPPENVRSTSRESGHFGTVTTDLPLGLLSLSAYIKHHAQVETGLVDFNILLNELKQFEYASFSELFVDILASSKWVDFPPDIIGISSLFTPAYQNTLDMAHCCQHMFPDALIVAGGGVPTNMHSEIFRDSACFDALCYGEGEKPLLGLVQAKDRITFLKENPSWITSKNSINGISYQHDLIEKLDDIPLLDYSVCQTEKYNTNALITNYTSFNAQKRSMHVMTSRGCPHHCCFCASHTVHGRRMRYYSIDRIRIDLKRIKQEYNVETIILMDDHFLANKQRALDILELLHELKLSAFSSNSLAIYALDKTVLKALKRVGVSQIVLSVESGSSRVLREIMHKPLDLDMVKRVTSDCRDLGIYTDVNILIGLPGETKADIEEARAYLKTIDANWFRINTATPLVGSEMFEICMQKEYLKGSHIDCDYKKAIVETEDFTAEYIQEMAYILNLELNFVKNNDLMRGRYETALKGFENVILAKDNHAFAYYYAAQCLEKLGHPETARDYQKTARTAAKTKFWRNYVDMFNITLP